jgi:hypothetical protein
LLLSISLGLLVDFVWVQVLQACTVGYDKQEYEVIFAFEINIDKGTEEIPFQQSLIYTPPPRFEKLEYTNYSHLIQYVTIPPGNI